MGIGNKDTIFWFFVVLKMLADKMQKCLSLHRKRLQWESRYTDYTELYISDIDLKVFRRGKCVHCILFKNPTCFGVITSSSVYALSIYIWIEANKIIFYNNSAGNSETEVWQFSSNPFFYRVILNIFGSYFNK